MKMKTHVRDVEGSMTKMIQSPKRPGLGVMVVGAGVGTTTGV